MGTSRDLPLKLHCTFARGNHLHKMIGEYKGHSFSLNTKLALEVPKDVAEVDVEHLQRKRIVERFNQHPAID